MTCCCQPRLMYRTDEAFANSVSCCRPRKRANEMRTTRSYHRSHSAQQRRSHWLTTVQSMLEDAGHNADEEGKQQHHGRKQGHTACGVCDRFEVVVLISTLFYSLHISSFLLTAVLPILASVGRTACVRFVEGSKKLRVFDRRFQLRGTGQSRDGQDVMSQRPEPRYI